MLAIAVSLLFGLTAFAALAVIRSALRVGLARTKAIYVELAEIERCERVTRAVSAYPRRGRVLPPALAAA